MNNVEIRDLIRVVNRREETIEDLAKNAGAVCSGWITEVALQGGDLIRIKASVPHGEWLPMFTSGQIKTHYESAKVYMRIAAKWEHATNLDGCTSIRQALALLTNGDDASGNGNHTPQRWPDFMEAIGKASKFVGFVERHSISTWPPEGLERLKEQLLPIALKLWPDRFAERQPSHD